MACGFGDQVRNVQLGSQTRTRQELREDRQVKESRSRRTHRTSGPAQTTIVESHYNFLSLECSMTPGLKKGKDWSPTSSFVQPQLLYICTFWGREAG